MAWKKGAGINRKNEPVCGPAGLVEPGGQGTMAFLQTNEEVTILDLSAGVRLLDGSGDGSLPDAVMVRGEIVEVNTRTTVTIAIPLPGNGGFVLTEHTIVSR